VVHIGTAIYVWKSPLASGVQILFLACLQHKLVLLEHPQIAIIFVVSLRHAQLAWQHQVVVGAIVEMFLLALMLTSPTACWLTLVEALLLLLPRSAVSMEVLS